MQLHYALTKEDFLQHQLYLASSSERIKRKRRNSWLIMTVIFLFPAYLFYDAGNNFMAACCLLCSLATFLFYPLYARKQYKLHYEKYIEEHYGNRTDNISTLTFHDNTIVTADSSGETKIFNTEIIRITELPGYFYLSMKAGGNIIIAKSQLSNVDETRIYLQQFAAKLQIAFVLEMNWKWK